MTEDGHAVAQLICGTATSENGSIKNGGFADSRQLQERGFAWRQFRSTILHLKLPYLEQEELSCQ